MFDRAVVHGEGTMFARSSRPQGIETLRLAALTRLQSLSFDELGALAPAADEVWVPAGRRLLLGGPLHHDLVLIAGGVGLVRCAGETVARLGPGNVFGELANCRPVYATATVFAATALHLVVFGTRALRDVRKDDPEAVEAFVAACSLDPAERATALAGARPAPQLKLVAAAAAA
jgi:CRP-like cAMP-binding protein